MKKLIQVSFQLAAISSFCILASCSSKEKTEVPVVDTNLKKSEVLNNQTQVGENAKGEFVHQEKTDALHDLIQLENEVMLLQDEVYGTEKYRSKGLYGQLKECRKKNALKTGELKYVPEKTFVMTEDQTKVGIEQSTQKYINWTEEKVADRMKRFQGYKQKFLDIREELEDHMEKCEVAKSTKTE